MLKSFLLISAAFGLFSLGGGETPIRGEHFGNWWVVGEEVVFRPQSPLPSGETLTVTVTDAENQKVTAATLPRAEFNRTGWRWRPAEPGFYEAAFSLDGRELAESYHVTLRSRDKANNVAVVAEEDFPITRHAFAVAPAKTREPREISPVFGMSPHFGFAAEEVPLSRLVGFHSVRIHSINWSQAEPREGHYDWSKIDAFMKLARENGYADNQLIFNIMATPRWASTRPEADWINVCIREYETVLPKDLESWRKFLREVIRRYPGVNRYELWNEPHLPGFSCFWADSVENFVKLLKAGSETIRQEKPEADIWLGGIGMRYLSFYEELLKLGGGNAFDTLPLHGSWMDKHPFTLLEKRFGVKEKPWVTSEWHAILMKPFQEEYPSERQLARTMLLDFLLQVKQGAREVDLFCILNLPNVERETLPFFRKHRSNTTHVSGLFRRRPYLQPRYPALTWQVFTGLITKELKVLDGYRFSDRSDQRAQLLESGSGPLLVLWNAARNPAKLDPALLNAARGGTLLSAEGRAVSDPAAFLLPIDTVLYIQNPNHQEIAAWKNTDDVLTPRREKLNLSTESAGLYRNGALFDDRLEPLNPKLREIDRQVVVNDGNKTTGGFAVGLTPKFIDLYVEVRDRRHHGTSGLTAWQGDSLQFALDTVGDGYADDRLEFTAALPDGGKPELWKQKAPYPGGDLPARNTSEGKLCEYAEFRIDRQGEITRYRIRLELSELYPFTFTPGKPLRFSLLVNNNDGAGRTSWIEWGSGIGGQKNPAAYGTLTVELPPAPVFIHSDLSRKSWKQDYRATVAAVTRVETLQAEQGAGVATPAREIVPGGRYRIAFEARGNARFQAIAGCGGRIDLVKPVLLKEDEWRKFEVAFTAPEGSKPIAITCFAWKDPGKWFEIRNFTMEPAAL